MADGIEVSPKSLADLRQLGAAYKGGDKVLQKRLRTGLQAAEKPLSEAVVRDGSAALPARGGLRARVAASRGAVTASLASRNVAVSIRATNRQKDALGALDSGLLRHPVYGHGKWVAQTIRANQFSDAFRRHAPDAQRRVNAEIAKALDEIAQEA
jgi:hypothetical protein